MKHFILLLVAFTAFIYTSKAQSPFPIDQTTNKIAWQETIPLDSVTKDEMYERCKRWLAHYYKSSTFDIDNKAIYTVSKTDGFIISLTYDFKYKSQNKISYTITLNQKDGKYRVTLTDFKFYNTQSGAKTQVPLETAYSKMTGQNKSETSSQVLKEVNTVLADLKTFMKTGAVKTQDDW